MALALAVTGCTRADRDNAERQANEVTSQARQEAKDLGARASATAQTVGETVADATAAASGEVANSLLGLKVKAALLDQLGIDGGRLSVDADGRHVTLTGSVNSETTSDRAWKVAGAVPGVDSVTMSVKVENDVAGALIDKQVDHAIASTQGTIADALLETRVKARLVEEMGQNAFAVEVEARDGVVSLSGTVADAIRRDLAAQTAGRTAGVTKVVNLLKSAA
jgi:osmotically-inducible protein OsmY